jgi:hypothetical protein
MRMAPLVAAMAGTLLWGGPGLAQDMAGPKCGSFTLEFTYDSITFVDLPPEGESPGDQRVIEGTLTDQDGNKVGAVYGISTLMSGPGPEGQDLILVNAIEAFPNGTISMVGPAPVPDAADENRGPDKPVPYAVAGGTGAFGHATGEITATTRDDGMREFSFDLTCD